MTIERIELIGIIILIPALLFVVGFMATSAVHHDYDDRDCHIEFEHDERSNNCKKFCEYDPQWFIWGKKKDCYWDDE